MQKSFFYVSPVKTLRIRIHTPNAYRSKTSFECVNIFSQQTVVIAARKSATLSLKLALGITFQLRGFFNLTTLSWYYFFPPTIKVSCCFIFPRREFQRKSWLSPLFCRTKKILFFFAFIVVSDSCHNNVQLYSPIKCIFFFIRSSCFSCDNSECRTTFRHTFSGNKRRCPSTPKQKVSVLMLYGTLV